MKNELNQSTDYHKTPTNRDSVQQPDSTKNTPKQEWKNSIPPCLLVRSGFWGSFMVPIFCGTFTCLTQTPNSQDPQFVAWTALTGALTILAGIRTSSQLKKAKEDIKSIQYEMSEYIKDPEYTLDLSCARNFPNMTSALVRHITQNNPGVFDRFIANPKSIPDNVTMQDVISAYLDKHSDTAPKILNALGQIKVKPSTVQYGMDDEYDPKTVEAQDDILPVSYELRRRLERCARRAAANAEKCR